ncbi:glycosyltransferase [Lysobacter sp. A6]|uniref:Glycosyltransferase n=1 Tax=Noviluteimonas lactosilytica TaxID=2888523 RepID=A0ABS8JG82_9GAMM|nr:glycosyltransferase [Lysobacter lactosilyticus]MCC8362602.1 glycosyltransferase [Lysobacter lactosilyticus]
MTMHDDHDHDGHDDNPWADRINEAYYDAMGAAFGQKTRERINWMCAQARGDTVLDVGCSQGIASILMAREGLRVTGLDIYPPAIEYAMGERAKEIATVQERLDFRCGELAALGDGQYDTVIMGEVVEHQTNPVRFIRQGAARVAPGGRIVVTVPYGLHPWPDHKSTIFPRHLHEALADEFTLDAIEVLEGYIRIVADRRPAGEAARDESDGLLRATETGALDVQTGYYTLSAIAQERAKANATLEQNAKVLREAQQKMTTRAFELERDLAVRTERGNGLQAALDTANKAHAEQSTQMHALREEHAVDAKRIAALQTQVVELQSELVKVRGSERAEADRVRAMQQQLEASAKRATELQDSAKQTRGKMDELRQELVHAQHKRSGHYAHLEAERERAVKFTEVVNRLHEENERYKHSVALAIGQAFLGLRSPRGIIGFPRAIVRAARAYRRRGSDGIPATPAPLPELRPVVVPPLASTGGSAARSSIPAMPAGDPANALSTIGWKQDIRPGTVPVMSVMDEFSRACFAPHASMIEPRPDNWEGLLETCKPRFLFVESSWKGNHGTWQYRVASYANPPGRELGEMVDGFQSRGVPTVFWNKEDPVHFNNFIDNAKRFDVVLTTAAEAVPEYEARTEARVGVLQFAAEESLHNPIGSAARNDKVCFAGSYYANRFEDRRADQLMLLDAATAFDLDIFDRNYSANASAPSDFAFPERFSPFVRGRLPYAEVGQAYRNYRVFLNVNSVIDSPTMFSRRVFELLACGTPIVSTWSRGTEEAFGNDLVWHVRTREEAEEAIRVLMTDDAEWRRRSLAGIRAVFARHTYRHRFRQVLDMLEIESPAADVFEDALVVADVGDQAQADAVVAAFQRQALAPGVHARLLLASAAEIRADAPHVVVARVDGGVEDALSRGHAEEGCGMIARLSPTAAYGQHYLQDLLHAARYGGADLTGKPADGREDSQYQSGIALDPLTLMCRRELLAANRRVAKSFFGQSASGLPEGIKTFASDTANFVRSGQGAEARALVE